MSRNLFLELVATRRKEEAEKLAKLQPVKTVEPVEPVKTVEPVEPVKTVEPEVEASKTTTAKVRKTTKSTDKDNVDNN